MERLNLRFYFVIFFIFFAVIGVGYVVLTDNESSAEDIEYYYAELKEKDIVVGEFEPRYIYRMKVLYKDSESDVPVKDLGLYEVSVKEAVFKGYGVKSVLKGYFDARGKFYLAGLSEDEPFEGLKPH